MIDLVLVSSDLTEHIEHIHVYDTRKHVLAKNIKTKHGIQYSESDHNVINVKLNLKWSLGNRKVIEVFKYNDVEAKKKFKALTTETNEFSNIVDLKKPLDVVTTKFLKRLKDFIHKSFTKVKIVDKPNKELESLYTKQRILK